MACSHSCLVLVVFIGVLVGATPAGTQLRVLHIKVHNSKPSNETHVLHDEGVKFDSEFAHRADHPSSQIGTFDLKVLQVEQRAQGMRRVNQKRHTRHSKLLALRHSRLTNASAGKHLRSRHTKKNRRHLVALELGSGTSLSRRRRRSTCTHSKQQHVHAFCDEEVGNWIDPDGHERRSLWCSGRPDKGKEDERCKNMADFRFCGQMLFSCFAQKKHAKRCCIGRPAVDECGDCQVAWQMRQETKCQQKFGERSVWDRDSPTCRSSWDHCTEGEDNNMYLECCTKPTGPKNLEDFCSLKRLQDPDHVDAACHVDHHVRGIKKLAKEFVEVTSGVTACNLPPPPSTQPNMPPLTPPLAKACIAPPVSAPAVPCLLPPAPAPEPAPPAAAPVLGPMGPAAAAPVWAAPAPFPAPPPAAIAGSGDDDVATTSALPPTTASPSPPPAMKLDTDDQCARMDKLALSIQAEVISLQKYDGTIKNEGTASRVKDTFNYDSEENSDPDLSQRVQQVIRVGEMLKQRSATFCQKHPPNLPGGVGGDGTESTPKIGSRDEDADDDDDGSDVQEDGTDGDEYNSASKEDSSPPAAQTNTTKGGSGEKAGAKDVTSDAEDAEKTAGDESEESGDSGDPDAKDEDDDSDDNDAVVGDGGGDNQAPSPASEVKAKLGDDDDDATFGNDAKGNDQNKAQQAGDGDGDSDVADSIAGAPSKPKKIKGVKKAAHKEQTLNLNRTDVEESLQAIFLMDDAINQVQTKVHPHSLKWWRWRYEYTVVEFFFLAPCLLILFAIAEMFRWFDRKYLGECTVVTMDTRVRHMTKFALISFFIRSVAVIEALFCLKVVRDYTAYEREDGTSTNIFDWFALFVRRLLNADSMMDSGIGMNLPYLGESYYNQMCDVLMHIWGAIWIYTVLMVMIIRCYICTYTVLKAFEKRTEQESASIVEEGIGRPSMRRASQVFRTVDSMDSDLLSGYKLVETYFMRKCVSLVQSALMDDDEANDTPYKTLAKHLKKIGIDMNQNISDGEREKFKFYRYIGVVFLRSTESLVHPGVEVIFALAIGALFAAFIGFYLHVAFVFFLPWILLSVLLVFVLLHYYAKRLWTTTMTEVPVELDHVPAGFEMLAGLFLPYNVQGNDQTCEYINAEGAVIFHQRADASSTLGQWRVRLSEGASHDSYVFFAKDSEKSPTPPLGQWMQKDGNTTIKLKPRLVESKHVSIHRHGQLIQLLLLCLSYSFSRLLYSSYIWRDYFGLFVAVLFGFFLTFLCIYLFALRTQVNFVFALALPPHRSIGHLNEDLEAVILHMPHHVRQYSDAKILTEISSVTSRIPTVSISPDPLEDTFPTKRIF